MTKFITRTIVSTEIQVAEMPIGGLEAIQLAPILKSGKVKAEKAVKIAQKHYVGKQVVVTALNTLEEKRKMSEEMFMELSEIVEPDEVVEELDEEEKEYHEMVEETIQTSDTNASFIA